MKIAITRPSSIPRDFERISNCYIGQLDGRQLYPPSSILSQIDIPPTELIFESISEAADHSQIEISIDELKEAVGEAVQQYVESVGASEVEGRFQDYLTDDIGVSVSEALALYRSEGLASFLLLSRIFISEPLSAICMDFVCFGEEYLDEHEFSLDWLKGQVEFVTPRGLMPEGSYPASRWS